MEGHSENPFERLPKMSPPPEAVTMGEGREERTSRRRFLKVGGAAAVAAVAVGTGAVLWKIGEKIREVIHESDPSVIARMYRDPTMTEPVTTPTLERYPYSESALLMHADEEKRLLPDHTDGVDTMIVIADNIANSVAQRVHREIRADSVQESLRVIGRSDEGIRQYCAFIASQLRRAGCFCHPEGSFHDAVGTKSNPSTLPHMFHLDCNLLCNVALHCAARHDVPLHAVNAPNHMYIGSPAYPDFAVEMTAFRDQLPDRLNAGFFSSHKEEREMWEFENDTVERIFGFFQPMTEEQVRGTAVLECCVEILDRVRDYPSHERLCSIVDEELARFPNFINFPALAHHLHNVAYKINRRCGRFEEANRHFQRMMDLRRDFGGRIPAHQLWWKK